MMYWVKKGTRDYHFVRKAVEEMERILGIAPPAMPSIFSRTKARQADAQSSADLEDLDSGNGWTSGYRRSLEIILGPTPRSGPDGEVVAPRFAGTLVGWLVEKIARAFMPRRQSFPKRLEKAA